MIGRRGYVYIFLREDGVRKVGWTVNVKQRRTQLRGMFGQKYIPEMSWEMGDKAAAVVEGKVHYLLRPFCVWGESSIELYAAPLHQLVAIVEHMIEEAASELKDGLETCWEISR